MHSTVGTRASDVPILLGHTYRKVSAHYYIQRDGKVFQFVPDNMAAWHAGASSWLGHGSGWIQSHSIGIELENTSDNKLRKQSYPDVQYNAAVELVRSLIQKYRVPSDYLVTHGQIAPVRKSDPVGFPWTKFRQDVFAGGIKPQTLVPDSTPEVIPPETPYETETADWLNIDEQINTAAETAVSNAVGGLWAKFVASWARFLDSFKRP